MLLTGPMPTKIHPALGLCVDSELISEMVSSVSLD